MNTTLFAVGTQTEKIKRLLVKGYKYHAVVPASSISHRSLPRCIVVLFLLLLGLSVSAQKVALKNNLLYDAVLTPNMTLEWYLAEKWTMQTEVGFNPFPLDDDKEHKWRHVLVDLEAKYWFCRAFIRDFIGVNVAYSHFNVSGGNYPVGWLYKDVKDHRLQGDMVAAGASYGWHFIVSPHVSFELEAGCDVGYAWFNRYDCGRCGSKIDSPRKWFAVPKAGVNLVIMLK